MNMNKIGILIGLVLLLSGFGFADTITNYVVPSSVPLNQEVTATGIYSDSDGNHPIVLCSFYILDGNSVVYRATDQYSTSTGRFTMAGKVLTEPQTVRGQSYSLHSECGTVSADGNFSVIQKQEAFNVGGMAWYPQGSFLDLLYIRDNSLVLFFFLIIVLFAVAVGLIWYNNFF